MQNAHGVMAIANAAIEPVAVPGCFVRINGTYDSLRAAEQRVADFILAHPEDLIHLTVTELAERTQTSESTVVRLVPEDRLQGLSRIQDHAGARSRRSDGDRLRSRSRRATRSPTLKQKVFQANAQALKDTMEVLSDEELAARRRGARDGPPRRDLRHRRQRAARARRVSQVHEARHSVHVARRQRHDGDVVVRCCSRATWRWASATPARAATSATRWKTRRPPARRRSASRTARRLRSPRPPTSSSTRPPRKRRSAATRCRAGSRSCRSSTRSMPGSRTRDYDKSLALDAEDAPGFGRQALLGARPVVNPARRVR